MLRLQGRLPGHPDCRGVYSLNLEPPGWCSRHWLSEVGVGGWEEGGARVRRKERDRQGEREMESWVRICWYGDFPPLTVFCDEEPKTITIITSELLPYWLECSVDGSDLLRPSISTMSPKHPTADMWSRGVCNVLNFAVKWAVLQQTSNTIITEGSLRSSHCLSYCKQNEQRVRERGRSYGMERGSSAPLLILNQKKRKQEGI